LPLAVDLAVVYGHGGLVDHNVVLQIQMLDSCFVFPALKGNQILPALLVALVASHLRIADFGDMLQHLALGVPGLTTQPSFFLFFLFLNHLYPGSLRGLRQLHQLGNERMLSIQVQQHHFEVRFAIGIDRGLAIYLAEIAPCHLIVQLGEVLENEGRPVGEVVASSSSQISPPQHPPLLPHQPLVDHLARLPELLIQGLALLHALLRLIVDDLVDFGQMVYQIFQISTADGVGGQFALVEAVVASGLSLLDRREVPENEGSLLPFCPQHLSVGAAKIRSPNHLLFLPQTIQAKLHCCCTIPLVSFAGCQPIKLLFVILKSIIIHFLCQFSTLVMSLANGKFF
jgi:hypothetical protein